MLFDRDILREVFKTNITIDPMDPFLLGPSSYDLTLGNSFSYPHHGVHIDARTGLCKNTTANGLPGFDEPVIIDDELVLRPGDFVLATTRERVELSKKLAARVEGKSSLGRLGLMVHATAGFIDPGFSGQITLEIKNLLPHTTLSIYPGQLIAQICFFRGEQPADLSYGNTGRYNGQVGVTRSLGARLAA